MKAVLVSSIAMVLVLAAESARAADHVACVGDSITAGTGLPSPSTQSYPAALASLLGGAYSVENDGHSGATLLHNGDLPYTSVSEYTTSSAYAAGGADVVIQLGTNDSKPANWANKASFEGDCEALVDHYRAAGAARVWINLVPPAFASACCSIDGTTVRDAILPLLRQCATNKGASTIDVYSALLPHAEYFDDGVHPNPTGAALLAATVRDALVKRPAVTATATGTTVTASPVAAYGKIERVEIFEGATSLGKVTAAPWTLTVSSLAPGSHALHAVATETGGRTASSSDVTILIAAPIVDASAPDASPTADASVPVVPDASTPDAAAPVISVPPSSPVVATPDGGGASPSPNATASTTSSDDGCNVGGGGELSTVTLTAMILAGCVRRRRRAGSPPPGGARGDLARTSIREIPAQKR